MTNAEQVVRSAIAALNRGDIEAALAYYAEDISLWVPGGHPDGQQVHGKIQLRSLFQQYEVIWADLWRSIHSAISDGSRVAIEMITVASEDGQPVTQPVGSFFVVRDGLIQEQRTYFDTGAHIRFLEASRNIGSS